MTASYGMVQPGIFRAPYMLTRGMSGGETDPLAALIGNALGTYTAGQEKTKADALAAQREQDQAHWRDLQTTIDMYKSGLTTKPPVMLSPRDAGRLTTDTSPTPATPSSAAAQPAVVGSGGLSLYESGPTAAERRAALEDQRKEDLDAATGGALWDRLSPGQPRPDRTTLIGIGRAPAPFASLQRAQDKPPGFHIEFVDDGSGHQTGKWVPDAPPKGTPIGPGGVATVPNLTRTKPPTPQEGQQAEFGTGALAAWRQVEAERTKNPGVEAEVGKVIASPVFTQAIPGFRSAADLTKVLETAGASPAAQRYMRAKWSFMDNIIRTRMPGGRMSAALFTQLGNEFLPSLDPAANSQLRINELQAIVSAQGQAGIDQNPDTWNRAAKRHGVSDLNVPALLQGPATDQRLTQIRGRY